MPFITQGKTNWKFLLIVIFLAIILGGGALWYTKKQNLYYNPLQIKEAENNIKKVQIPEKTVVPLGSFTSMEDAIIYYLNQNPNNKDFLYSLTIEMPVNPEKEIYKPVEEKLVKWMEKADLNNDGVEELVVIFIDPLEGMTIFGFPSKFTVLSEKEQSYKVIFTSDYASYSSYFVRDVNKDNKLEIVLVADWCGASTCGKNIVAIQFDGQEWRNLTPNVGMASDDIQWVDQDGDGMEEIILHGGLGGSVGAGLQREYTDIYAYRDGKYHLIKTIGDPSTNIYYLMLDANKSLREDNLTDALKLATQALQNPNSGVSSDEYSYINERDQVRILSYVAIEVMLTYLKRSPSNLNSVDSLLQDIKQKYDKLDNPYINAAQVLRDMYVNTQDVVKACQAMENEILKVGENAEFLHWYGYNTEKLDLKNLCP